MGAQDHFNILSNMKELFIMSSTSLLHIWRERVQKDSIGLNLALLEFRNLTFETIPQGSSATIQRKRQRPLSDVDGEVFRSNKKRRLRLHLITSRLSRPFSFPATYIYNRNRSNSAWARKPVERGAIWKAAMANHCRLRILAAQQKQEQRAQRPILPPNVARLRPALRPSPLGHSQYAACDLEVEDDENDCGHVGDDEDKPVALK